MGECSKKIGSAVYSSIRKKLLAGIRDNLERDKNTDSVSEPNTPQVNYAEQSVPYLA